MPNTIIDVPGDGSCSIHAQILSTALFVTNSQQLLSVLNKFNTLAQAHIKDNGIDINNTAMPDFLKNLKSELKDAENQKTLQDFEEFFPGLITPFNNSELFNVNQCNKKEIKNGKEVTTSFSEETQFHAMIKDHSLTVSQALEGYQIHDFLDDTQQYAFPKFQGTEDDLLANKTPGVQALIENFSNYDKTSYFQGLKKGFAQDTTTVSDQVIIEALYDIAENSLKEDFKQKMTSSTNYKNIFSGHLQHIQSFLSNNNIKNANLPTDNFFDETNYPNYLEIGHIRDIIENKEQSANYSVNGNFYIDISGMDFFRKVVAPEFSLTPTGSFFNFRVNHYNYSLNNNLHQTLNNSLNIRNEKARLNADDLQKKADETIKCYSKKLKEFEQNNHSEDNLDAVLKQNDELNDMLEKIKTTHYPNFLLASRNKAIENIQNQLEQGSYKIRNILDEQELLGQEKEKARLMKRAKL